MPERMASMLTVNMGGDAGERPLTFDDATARHVLHKLFAFVERAPRDATVKISGGAVTATPSRSGIELDMPRLLSDLDAAAAVNGLRTVYVALRVVEPTLTTADVQEMGLSALGSQFSTYFDPSNTARAGNIALAAKIADGTIVRPGSVLSQRRARPAQRQSRLRLRTRYRCRRGAPSGRGRRHLPVCDHALQRGVLRRTTLVERHPHSLYIDHYPVGRDATVAWGGPDFKFRNNTGRPLMIRSWTDNGVLTVVIVGRTGRSVSYTTSPFYDIRPPRTSKDDPRVIYDSSLSAGIVKWEPGWTGKSVKVVRTVRQNEWCCSRTPSFPSTSRRTGSSGSAHGRLRGPQTGDGVKWGRGGPQVPPAMTCLQTSLSVSNTPTPETAQASTTGEPVWLSKPLRSGTAKISPRSRLFICITKGSFS